MAGAGGHPGMAAATVISAKPSAMSRAVIIVESAQYQLSDLGLVRCTVYGVRYLKRYLARYSRLVPRYQRYIGFHTRGEI